MTYRMQSTMPGQQVQQQQQQQQMVVTTGNQTQPTPQWLITVPRPNTVPNYVHRQSSVLGVVIVVVGILSIVFNIVDLVVWTDAHLVTSMGFVGHGIWSGVMSVVAGGFGIGAGRRRNNTCLIRAFLVLCIIAACFDLGQFITALIGTSVANSEYNRGRYGRLCCVVGGCGQYYDYHFSSYQSQTTSSSTVCNNARTQIAMEALLAILSLIGGIAAIWGSALGCRAACCCCVDPYSQQFAIVENNGIPMTIIAPQQQGGQMLPVMQYHAQNPTQYPLNIPTSYPGGGYAPPEYQLPSAPPYYHPPSTALGQSHQPPRQPDDLAPPAYVSGYERLIVQHLQ